MLRILLPSILVALVGYTYAQDLGESLEASFRDYLALKQTSPYRFQWIPVGPVLNSARAEAVQAHPDRPGLMYAAFGSGGLWKTTNNGLSWQVIFENQPSQGIGDFALAPSNPEIIYLGTGESLRKARNFTMPGNGIYKSEDGGDSWFNIGLKTSGHIAEIAVHPENPDIVLVAVLGDFWSLSSGRGIFRTENGGKNWEMVLVTDENTGANDIIISQSDPNRMYATTWEFKAEVRGDKNYNNVGPGSGVYVSNDAGKTWEKCSKGLPQGDKMGRSGVTVSYQDPDKAYWFVDNQANREGETGEVYRTIDGGLTWEKVNRDPLKLLSVVNWYFMDTYVSPNNDDELYILGVRVGHSIDGGLSFEYLNGEVAHLNPSPAQGLHLDHCELWINPENHEHLILANDGGVYSSLDNGLSWLHHNNIPTGEFYDITLETGEDYNIYGGVQDDATVFGPAKEWNPMSQDPWQYLWIDPWNGGDGCITQLDPADPNILYYSAQEGAVRRLNKQTGESIGIRPQHPDSTRELRFNFITPYFISKYDNQTLYHGGNFVFKSENRGNIWSVISPDLAKAEKKSRGSVAAGALAESAASKGLLYYGTDHGAFWISLDDGTRWQEYSRGLPDAYIRSIEPSKFKVGRVYVALSGINYDDLNAYLYVSENHGKKWLKITSNLPNEPINKIVEDPTNENILYAGGYRGVYVSVDRGQSWALFGSEMPAASVSDIEINETTNDMVVATHGRGIYYLNLNDFRNSINLDKREPFLFEPASVRAPQRGIPGSYIDKSQVEKLPITFWIPGDSNFKLRILNREEELWSYTGEGRQGVYQYRWNMVTRNNESDQPYFIRYNEYIGTGVYRLILELNGKTHERELILK